MSVFRSAVATAQESQDWKTVLDYYAVVFGSFTNMNMAFKVISHCSLFTTTARGLLLLFIILRIV